MSGFNPIKSGVGYFISKILSEYLQDGESYRITNDQISQKEFTLKNLKLDCKVSFSSKLIQLN